MTLRHPLYIGVVTVTSNQSTYNFSINLYKSQGKCTFVCYNNSIIIKMIINLDKWLAAQSSEFQKEVGENIKSYTNLPISIEELKELDEYFIDNNALSAEDNKNG